MLNQYVSKKRISFSMPGHKGGQGMPKGFDKKLLKYDVTELADTDNLHMPKQSIKAAKKLAADFFGAQDTHFLVNGSTSGIYAMLAATANPGDTVILDRACHISAINACIILGIKPVFIFREIMGRFSIPMGINQKNLIDVLDENHDAKAILITSPSYYGIASDIETISKIARARGIPLLVDEAHGAHFAADQTLFPRTAISQGADLTVQSAHKTLNAMNQAAYLHVNSDLIDKNRLVSVLAMLQTSSPSYLIAASADIARADLAAAGKKKWQNVYNNCEELRRKISSKTKVDFISSLLNGRYNVDSVDETRIVMNFSAYKTTGFEIGERLRKEYNIDIEMADIFNVVAIATPANKASDFSRLSKAVISICEKLSESDEEPVFPPVPIPKMGITPQQAFYAKGRNIRLDEAIGRVSRSTVTAYPPAVPIICTGEIIERQSIEYIEALKKIKAELIGLNANGFISIAEI
ncbi:MAG: aminotransferase class I/II-fold pyridoxal phosphate-dependent enzyme [Clostridia bacterium]|nr:aminotransferase class I/II-fold pyridoxal phosphate-dependent enzyme [Clostridia bacterium]